jgi:hypothetical protein
LRLCVLVHTHNRSATGVRTDLYEMRYKYSKRFSFLLDKYYELILINNLNSNSFNKPAKFNFRNSNLGLNIPWRLARNTILSCFQLPKNKAHALLADFYFSFNGGHVTSLCGSLGMQLKSLSLTVIQTATFTTHDLSLLSLYIKLKWNTLLTSLYLQ